MKSAIPSRRPVNAASAVVLVGIALVVGALLVTAIATAELCSPSEIEVKKVSWKKDGAFLRTFGEITNHCRESVGVEVETTLRDASGKIVSTAHYWPKGTNNLDPNEKLQFKYILIQADGKNDPSMATTTVISVHKW